MQRGQTTIQNAVVDIIPRTENMPGFPQLAKPHKATGV